MHAPSGTPKTSVVKSQASLATPAMPPGSYCPGDAPRDRIELLGSDAIRRPHLKFGLFVVMLQHLGRMLMGRRP